KQNIFCFSNLPEDHELYSTTNKGEYGFLTDEYNGVSPSSGYFIKPKLYSVQFPDGTRKLGVKGVPKRHAPSHEDFRAVLFNQRVITKTIPQIRQKAHQNMIIKPQKICAQGISTKRWFSSRNESLPFGHYRL